MVLGKNVIRENGKEKSDTGKNVKGKIAQVKMATVKREREK